MTMLTKIIYQLNLYIISVYKGGMIMKTGMKLFKSQNNVIEEFPNSARIAKIIKRKKKKK